MQPRDLRDYSEPAVLRDGGSLWVRSLRPSDKPLLVDLFKRLSPTSVWHRYFGAKTELTPGELSYFTELDHATHVGLAAMLRERGEERMVGVARYFVLPERPTVAEAAFTVVDEHQGRGIGTALLEHLAEIGRARGLEHFVAEVMADNARMLEVFGQSGFTVSRAMDSGVFHVEFPIGATAAFAAASLARERSAKSQSMRVFFKPRSIAVFGASRRPGGIGRAILGNIVRCGYRGPVYPIHPEASELDGLACHKTLAAVGAPVDLAIIAVPARAVEDVVTECAVAGVRGVVVISAGFAEMSAEGRAAQDRIRRLVRGSGMRMVGPNCMGVLDASPDASLNATFAPTWPPAGNVSILTQSGALGLAMLDHAAGLNIGLAGFVSVGNKGDVSGNDLLSYWAEDPQTGVIALYLESFGNPRKFARIAPEVARVKPIVAVKSGRSAAGTRAAASHSAALASLDVGIDALFAQAGVIRTGTLEEMFDVVALLATQPVPRGPRVGIVTNAGGPGILLADACEAHGLAVPELGAATHAALQAFLPPQAGLANPVDMIASAPPEHFARAIEAVGNDPAVDSLVVIYIPPLVTHPEEVAAAIARAAGTVPAHKPVATVFISSKGAPAILATGPRGKLPSYSFPENAALALAAAVRYGRFRARPRGAVLALEAAKVRQIRRIVEQATGEQRRWLSPRDTAAILELADIPLAPLAQTAPDPDAAAAAADTLGYPLVAKAVAEGLVHKSDVGGVILGLESADAVRRAVRTLAGRVPGLEAVVLQRQVDTGPEMIVGVTTDPSLGPIMVAGLGGVQAELLRDVALRLTPLSDLDAAEMLGELRGGRILDGFRGAPPADRAAFEEVIRRVAALVEAVPELLELELNPVKVLPRGHGCMAVDARMRIAASGER